MEQDDNNMNDTLRRIRRMLDERGWSLYQLAKEAGMPKSTLTNMFARNTQPTMYNIEKICEAFGVPVGYFFESEPTIVPDAFVLNTEEQHFLEVFRSLPNQKRTLLNIYMSGLAGIQVNS